MKNSKNLKVLKYIIIGLAIILLIELIYFGIKMIKTRKDTTYYSAINNVITIDNGYAAVGLSDKKHSDFKKYEKPGYNKPYIWLYDDNLNIKEEIELSLGYNGNFNDIIEIEDGYIVVGTITMNEKQHMDGSSEGVIIKYNKDFEIVWRKNLNLIGITKFNSVVELEDKSLLVAGSSVYEPNMIGNHTNGGAIVVKYTSDGEQKWVINHGGPKTGEFNDIALTDGGFIVVGTKAGNTGIIFKYDFNGKELWHNYYGYSDAEGLTSITKINNNEFIVTGTKLNDKDNTDDYKAAVLKYNKNGKLLTEKLYQKEKISRFNNALIFNDKIYVIGGYGHKVNNTFDNDAMVITYDSSLNQLTEEFYNGDNTYTLNDIIKTDNGYLLAGHTNSKIKEIQSNGLDYYQILIKK